VHQLEIKVLNITDARCNHEVYGVNVLMKSDAIVSNRPIYFVLSLITQLLWQFSI